MSRKEKSGEIRKERIYWYVPYFSWKWVRIRITYGQDVEMQYWKSKVESQTYNVEFSKTFWIGYKQIVSIPIIHVFMSHPWVLTSEIDYADASPAVEVITILLEVKLP